MDSAGIIGSGSTCTPRSRLINGEFVVPRISHLSAHHLDQVVVRGERANRQRGRMWVFMSQMGRRPVHSTTYYGHRQLSNHSILASNSNRSSCEKWGTRLHTLTASSCDSALGWHKVLTSASRYSGPRFRCDPCSSHILLDAHHLQGVALETKALHSVSKETSWI